MNVMITICKYLVGILIFFSNLQKSSAPIKDVKGEIMKKELIAKNGTWRYETLGEGPKGVVFIHGASSSSRVWKYQKDSAILGHKSIYVDLLGYGSSDKPDKGYSMENWVVGIHAIAQQEDLKEIVLVAHSNGVIVAKEYYRNHPKYVSKMLLLDGMLKQLLAPEMLDWFRSSLERSDYADYMKNNIENMPVQGLKEEDVEILKKDGLSTPKAVTLAEFNVLSDPNTWEPLDIRCPVTIVHANNPMWDAEYMEWLTQSIPRLTLKEWNDAGHFLQLQYPVRLNRLIESMLN